MIDDSTGLALRPLRRGDAEAGAALIRLAFAAQAVATDPPSSALRETADSVGAWMASGGGAVLTRGAGLVALLLWAERDGGLYCGRLAVSPAERGKGLARRLIGEAERHACDRNLPRLHVRVRLVLPDNLRLFESLGFTEIGRDAHPGYAEPTFSLLEKRLVG